MTDVYLGLGSNLMPEQAIAEGLEQLRQKPSLWQVECESPWYWSSAYGFDGPDFLNLVVKLRTELPLEALLAHLRAIECALGRPTHAQKYASRRFDIDVLLFGDCVTELSPPSHPNGVVIPRLDVYRHAFVLRPLLDIAPTLRCPRSQQPLANGLAQVSSQRIERYAANRQVVLS